MAVRGALTRGWQKRQGGAWEGVAGVAGRVEAWRREAGRGEARWGEAACLVFSVWGRGLDADGRILWEKEPEFDTDQKALPRRLTDVQENGDALQFDSARKRYVKTEEFDTDKMNGYSRFKVFLLRQRTKTR